MGTWKLNGAALFTALLIIFFLVFGTIATGYIHNAWIFPVLAASGGIAACVVRLVRDLRSGGEIDSAGFDIAAERSVPTDIAYKRAAKFVGWIVGLYIVIWLVGFKLGVIVYFVVFLRLEGQAGWLTILLLTATMFIVLLLFESFLGIYWPNNLLKSLVKLPYLT